MLLQNQFYLMEPEVHKVLLWLYQENQWLYIIHILQGVIIFSEGRINSNIEGKTHQIQITPPNYKFFLEQQLPNQL